MKQKNCKSRTQFRKKEKNTNSSGKWACEIAFSIWARAFMRTSDWFIAYCIGGTRFPFLLKKKLLDFPRGVLCLIDQPQKTHNCVTDRNDDTSPLFCQTPDLWHRVSQAKIIAGKSENNLLIYTLVRQLYERKRCWLFWHLFNNDAGNGRKYVKEKISSISLVESFFLRDHEFHPVKCHYH